MSGTGPSRPRGRLKDPPDPNQHDPPSPSTSDADGTRITQLRERIFKGASLVLGLENKVKASEAQFKAFRDTTDALRETVVLAVSGANSMPSLELELKNLDDTLQRLHAEIEVATSRRSTVQRTLHNVEDDLLLSECTVRLREALEKFKFKVLVHQTQSLQRIEEANHVHYEMLFASFQVLLAEAERRAERTDARDRDQAVRDKQFRGQIRALKVSQCLNTSILL